MQVMGTAIDKRVNDASLLKNWYGSTVRENSRKLKGRSDQVSDEELIPGNQTSTFLTTPFMQIGWRYASTRGFINWWKKDGKGFVELQLIKSSKILHEVPQLKDSYMPQWHSLLYPTKVCNSCQLTTQRVPGHMNSSCRANRLSPPQIFNLFSYWMVVCLHQDIRYTPSPPYPQE